MNKLWQIFWKGSISSIQRILMRCYNWKKIEILNWTDNSYDWDDDRTPLPYKLYKYLAYQTN